MNQGQRKTSPHISGEAVANAFEETRREASAYAHPLQGVVLVEIATFLKTTALQR